MPTAQERAQADLPRTDWFNPEVDPTIPGNYECTSLANESGFVFQRRWDGEQWISSVTRLPTKVRMFWRGIEPGSIDIGQYPSQIRLLLRETSTPAQAAELHDNEFARAA
jgi:hypothetical protein